MARFFQRPAMFAALAACAVLVLAQAADAAAADSARALGFMDSLRGHQPDTAAHKAAAKTASSATAGGCYNGETTTTSLRAVQWKDCGSRPSELVYPFFFTTDLACDDGHDAYYQHGDSFDGIFAAAVATAATCTWEVDVREYKIEDILHGEIGAVGSPPVHIGKATFNCYFNKEADSCDAPVCSSLVLSGQGDWWHTWAESKTGNVSTPLDTTNKYCIDITKPASPYKSGPARVAAAAAPAKHDDGDDHYGHASEHWGEAYVFTGLFQSVGAHGDVEGNGLFEYTHKFVAHAGPPPGHLPHVAPGKLQLRFTREEAGPAHGKDATHY